MEIVLRMVAVQERVKAGMSERAVTDYEKKRVFKVERVGHHPACLGNHIKADVTQRDPVSVVCDALAERLGKDTEDLVLLHNGTKIYSLGRSFLALGITENSELSAYLLRCGCPFWDTSGQAIC
jgi:hypothetical protein